MPLGSSVEAQFVRSMHIYMAQAPITSKKLRMVPKSISGMGSETDWSEDFSDLEVVIKGSELAFVRVWLLLAALQPVYVTEMPDQTRPTINQTKSSGFAAVVLQAEDPR